jgi:hypothetical protein
MIEFYEKYPGFREQQFKYGKVIDEKKKNTTNFGGKKSMFKT